MEELFSNIKIKYKLLIIYFCVFFIILTTSGFFIYNNVKAQIEMNIESDLTQSINLISKMIETISNKNAEKKLKEISVKNKLIMEYYYKLYSNGELSKEEALKDLKKIYSNEKVGKSGYIALILNDKKHKKYLSILHPYFEKETDFTNIDIVKQLMDIKDGYLEYLWKNKTEKVARKKAMYTTYFEPWDLAITVTSYISELSDIVNIKDIKQDVEFYKIGANGYMYIINSNANIIYHPTLNDSNFDKVTKETNIEVKQLSKAIIKEKNGRVYYSYLEKSVDELVKRDKIALFRYIPKLDWYVIASAYTEEFNTPLKKLKSNFIASFILLSLFMILTTVWISSSITKPLYDIIDKIKDSKNKNFKEKIDIITNDEFGELSKHYNEFVDTLEASSIELANTARKFHAISDNTTAIMYIKNLDGEYESINKEYKNISKLSDEDIVGKNDIDIFGKKIGSILYNNDKVVIKEKRSITFEEVVYFNDKKYYYISIKFPFFDESNNITSICGISTDITNMKESEDRIIILNKNLEYEVTKRTSDLLMSNVDLEKSLDNLKDAQAQLIHSEKMASLGDLVAGISHEINTPVGLGVTGITHLEFLTKQINDLYKDNNISKAEFEEYLSTSMQLTSSIHTNLNRAASLIKSFKQVAVDQTSEEKRTFYVKKYLDEILTSLGHTTKNFNCDFVIECDENIKVFSCPGSFAQIITNFVMNSLIHGFKNKKSGVININITEENNKVLIVYKDNGEGISQENLSKIYNPFFTTNRNHGGSGLGLNIVYNIITTTLNGKITCESVEDEGVTFTITIPLIFEI